MPARLSRQPRGVGLPWGLRWWELLPELVLGAGLGLFLVTETSAATSAFKSGTAVRLMLVVGAAWLAARFALVRYTGRPHLRLIVFGLAALGVLWIVVLPAYRDTTVVETLPVAAGQPPTATTAAAPSTSGTPTTPAAAPSSGPGVTAAPPAVVTTSVPPPAAEPVALRSAPLHGIDHRASGTATVFRLPDGSLVVGLLDIDIQPGPDYDVFVVPGSEREDTGGGVRLDDLRGNKGTQFYEVPGDTDVSSGEWTTLVWCQTFDVPVAGATPV